MITVTNKYSSDMKEKIIDILERHYYVRNQIESRCADELLNLFDVSNSFCEKHIWKAYDMPFYVRCAKCGKQWNKNDQNNNDILGCIHKNISSVAGIVTCLDCGKILCDY